MMYEGRNLDLTQGSTNPGPQVILANKLFMIAPNVWRYSLHKLLYVSLLVLRNLRWQLDF